MICTIKLRNKANYVNAQDQKSIISNIKTTINIISIHFISWFLGGWVWRWRRGGEALMQTFPLYKALQASLYKKEENKVERQLRQKKQREN